jgi:asparagine synthase (glutamine-hydrolysing)
MSGIAGIYYLDGRPVEQTDVQRMLDSIAHRGPDGCGVWTNGSVGLGCQLLRVTPESAKETQPFIHPSGNVVVFDGRLDNRKELLETLRNSAEISASSPDPAFVLAAYHEFGDKFVEHLIGDFALGLFDLNRQKLLLARDAIGVRPLYFYSTPRQFLFASEIKALLTHPQVSTHPNNDFLAEFLLHSLPRENQGETGFSGVYSLLPAHMAFISSQGLLTQRYWDFDPTRLTRLGSVQEYVEAFRFHFERAVQRRLRSAYPIATSISGGLDSSAIFCLAETFRRSSPERYPANLGISYTCGDWAEAEESAFLVEIEREYDITIERFPLIVMGFFEGARDEVWQSEYPLVDEIGANFQALFRSAHRRGARVMLTGLWGDQILFPQGYLVDLFRRLEFTKVIKHIKEYRRWLTDVDPKFYRRKFFHDLVRYIIPEAIHPFFRVVRKYVNKSHELRPWYTEEFRQRVLCPTTKQTLIKKSFRTMHAKSLYAEATAKHHVQALEWLNKLASTHGLEMAFPFLDRDLVSFLMGIPGDIQTWKGIPKWFLRESMRGVMPDAIVNRTWKADLTRPANESMMLTLDYLFQCLHPDGVAVRLGYLDADVLREELHRLRHQIQGPTCEITWSLAELLGLELWLQVFFSEGSKQKGGSESCKQKTVASATMI